MSISKEEFCKKLRALKRRSQKIANEMNWLIFDLEDEGVDINAESNAENADSIADAITCYIDFGEYSPEKIWDEIERSKKG